MKGKKKGKVVVCPNCGKENMSDYKFCLMCGSEIEVQDADSSEERFDIALLMWILATVVIVICTALLEYYEIRFWTVYMNNPLHEYFEPYLSM